MLQLCQAQALRELKLFVSAKVILLSRELMLNIHKIFKIYAIGICQISSILSLGDIRSTEVQTD